MKFLTRLYILASTAAVVGLGVAYYYEASMAERYESGALVNVAAAEQVTYRHDWLEALELAKE